MRRLLPWFLLLVLMSSCIPVESLGAYWVRGVIDTLLLGTWTPDPSFKRHYSGEPLIVARYRDVYQIDSPDERVRQRPDYRPTYGRTLKIGDYLFFMEGPNPGNLLRYEIKGNILQIYTLNARGMRPFLQANYSHGKNVRIDKCAVCRTRRTNDESFDGVKIKLLDEEVFGLIAKIPRNQEFWTLERGYLKATEAATISSEQTK